MKKKLSYVSLVILIGGILFSAFGNPANIQSASVPYSLSPQSGAVITKFPLTLSWKYANTSQETFNYEIYPGFIEEFNRDNMREGGMAVGWSAEIAYLPADQYTWRVQACEFKTLEEPPTCEGTSLWFFQTLTVQAGAAPPPPAAGGPAPPKNPKYPQNGAINIPLSPILQWEDVVGANQPYSGKSKGYIYTYWPEGEKAKEMVVGKTGSNSVLVNLATGGKKYLWQVQSCEKDYALCGKPNDPPWSFTAIDCPEGQTRPHNRCEGATCKTVNTCGASDCEIGATCTESSKDSISGGAIDNMPKGKLEVDWPNSPMGTSLNDSSTLTDLIKYLYDWGIGLGGFAAFIALIIAGVQYLTSAGDAGKMKEAMNRIRDAGLGLVLLLSSFLILNTINPQLTELKIPTLPIGGDPKNLESITATTPNPLTEECKTATLYGGRDFQQPYNEPPITLGKTEFKPKREIGSVKMAKNCQLFLYQFSNCTESADSGSTPLIGDTSDVGLNSGGVTVFGCAKLNKLDFKLTQ